LARAIAGKGVATAIETKVGRQRDNFIVFPSAFAMLRDARTVPTGFRPVPWMANAKV